MALRTGYTPAFQHSFKGFGGRGDEGGAECRRDSRNDGANVRTTSGRAPGFVQANVVILPKAYAFDFVTFCLRNPKFCPLLAVTDPGQTDVGALAAGSNIRTDIPMYRLYRDGEADPGGDVDRITDDVWSDDLVTCLLGCSFSWEDVLADAGLVPRQIEEQKNVPMYRTNISSNAAGPFGGPLVVSMRPYRPEQLEDVYRITDKYPGAHGSPIHWGDPAEIGIDGEQLANPPWGEGVTIRDGEVPVFWACGVSSQVCE